MIQSSRKLKTWLEKIFIYIALLLVLSIALFPILWLFLISIKTRAIVFTLPPPVIFTPTLSNYITAFIEKGYLHYFINSLIVAVGTTGIALSFGSLAAFGFSRFKFLADKHLFFWILTFRMSPVIVFIIPYFLIYTTIGLYDTLLGLILAHSTFTLPIVIWIMKGFFDDLPREIEESALIDGCTRLGSFRQIVLPLAAPGLVAAAILSFMFSWNEFFFASILTTESAKTLPAAMTGFITTRGILWGEMAAVACTILIPVLILVVFIQKYLARGLTFGAVR